MDKVEKFLITTIVTIMLIAIISIVVSKISDDNTQTLTDKDLVDDGNLKRLELDGHKYFLIVGSKGIAVVHNEACQCKK
jgi:hypothetical protein